MNWDKVVEKVTPHIVKIETQTGYGTGFFIAYNADKSLSFIATALHVVSHADQWQQPIKILTPTNTAFLPASQRVILTPPYTDSAVILLQAGELQFPESPIPLRPIETPVVIGEEVGWLGYPEIEPYTLCFFAGSISARRADSSAYFIDGVAINGVSGGPLIYSSTPDGVQFVGVVSAYRANRQPGEVLPGLLIAQDVSHFQQVVQNIRSQDEAIRERVQLESQLPQGESSQ